MKKIILFLTVILIVISPSTKAQDFSAVSPSGQTLYYNIVDGHAEVVHPGGYPPPQNYVTGDLVIPSSVEYNGQTYIVTSLSYTGWNNRGAFENCSGLTSVSIPNTVTNIGGGAFRYCTGLTNVELSNTVDYLGDECFDHCSSLTEITIPSSASHFGDNCFCACTSLVSIYVCSQFLNSFSNLSFSVGNYGNSNCTAYIPCWFEPFLSMIANSWTSTVLWNPFDVVMSANNNSWGYSVNNCNSIEAFANEGCYFIAWSDGDTSNPRDIYLTQDTSFTAIFAIDSHNVVVQVDEITHGICDGGGRYAYGSPVTITATPYSGFQFSHWSDGSIYNPYTFAVTDDVQLTAYFYAAGTPYQDTIVVYDTLYVNVPVHDTTIIMDTMTLTEYIPVHDTTYIDVFVHDTTVIVDTVTLTEFDTAFVYIPYAVHDTTIIVDTVTLTEFVPVHDTTVVVDTVTLTEFVSVHDTTYITLTDTVINTVYDTTVVDNYIYDTTIVTDTVTIDNFIFDTTVVVDTLRLTDTIYITDTVYVGVDDVTVTNIKMYVQGSEIVVENAEGYTVSLYDAVGRLIERKVESGERKVFAVPVSGTYLVKVGNLPARKIVVVR